MRLNDKQHLTVKQYEATIETFEKLLKNKQQEIDGNIDRFLTINDEQQIFANAAGGLFGDFRSEKNLNTF